MFLEMSPADIRSASRKCGKPCGPAKRDSEGKREAFQLASLLFVACNAFMNTPSVMVFATIVASSFPTSSQKIVG